MFLKRMQNVLYLDALQNQTESNTHDKFVICHQKIEGIRGIPELTPSVPLLKKWESRFIGWDKFQQRFKAELREEYRKGDISLLKRLANYCVKNEVTLYSPEPAGERTYRAILTEVINKIWEQLGEKKRAIDRAAKSELNNIVFRTHLSEMAETANRCAHFQPIPEIRLFHSCLFCEHLDARIYACKKLGKPVICYRWYNGNGYSKNSAITGGTKWEIVSPCAIR